MDNERPESPFDSMILRFAGEDGEGRDLHELHASHVSEVLQGLVELTKDFDEQGVFHDPDVVGESMVYVKPAEEGSFLIEVFRVLSDGLDAYGQAVAVGGAPTLATIFAWSTRSARADVADFDELPNGNIKIKWQDNTAQEVTPEVWKALNKNPRRRKKQLRKIMKPLDDDRVTSLEVSDPTTQGADDDRDTPTVVATLGKEDYAAVYPSDEIEEFEDFFEGEAQMSAIDFDNPEKWKVKTRGQTRQATVEDEDFLKSVTKGLAISRDDIFWVRIREDRIKKNGRNRTYWTVLSVEWHRRNRGDNDSAT